ncbi:SpoVR family protein, partial [Yersinia pestis]
FPPSHTNVVYQPPYNSPYYNGINPYALGFAMFQDIKQICQSPTEEDYYWFPDIAGKDWLDTLHFAMRDFKDESFISQFLSPKIMRDFRLFTVLDDDKNNYLEISAIHNEEGYRTIRNQLSAQYNLSNHEPNIQVWNVDLRGDRSLTLRYIPHDRAPLDKSRQQVMKHIHRLGGG